MFNMLKVVTEHKIVKNTVVQIVVCVKETQGWEKIFAVFSGILIQQYN